MGTLLRHGSDEQKQRLPARRSPPASCACRPSASPSPTPARTRPRMQDRRAQRRRPLRRQRPQGLHLARPALRPDGPARPHHALRRAQRQVARPSASSSSTCATPSATARPSTRARHDDQQRHQRARLQRPRGPGRQPHRRGGRGLPPHHRRLERRAHPHRRASPSATAAGSSNAPRVRAREREVFGRPIGANQGVQFPIAQAYAARRGRRPHARQGRLALRRTASPAAPRPTWRSCSPPRPPGRPPTPAMHTLRRLRLRQRVRRRAQVPRDAPVPGRADLHEPHPGLRRPARARPARAPSDPPRARTRAGGRARSRAARGWRGRAAGRAA